MYSSIITIGIFNLIDTVEQINDNISTTQLCLPSNHHLAADYKS